MTPPEEQGYWFTLDCGRRVTLRGVYFDDTYAGLLEGRPVEWLNNQILDRAKTKTDVFPGKTGLYLIPPEIDLTDPSHPTLPSIRLYVSLLCFAPIDPQYMASALNVVCFVDKFVGRPIEEVINEHIHPLNWDDLAKDFDW